MKKLLLVLSGVLAVGLIPASAGAHPTVDCRSQNACINHCLSWHLGVERATCLVTHNILN